VGGTVSLQGNLTLSRFFWQQGNLRVNGQTLTMNGHNLLNDNGTIELNGGTLIQGGGSELQNRGLLVGPGTINGRVQNRGTIRVGSGASDVLAINAPAMRNFAGATISLNGGTLTHTGATAILNEGRILGPGRLNVTLPVENAAGGVIQVGGGAQAGVLVVDGGLQLDAGSLLSVEIGGTAAGTDYSQLVVTGHLTLGGTLAVVLLNGFLPDPETPDTFQVVTFDSVEGAFANDDQTVDLGNGLFLDIDYDLTDVTLVTRG